MKKTFCSLLAAAFLSIFASSANAQTWQVGGGSDDGFRPTNAYPASSDVYVPSFRQKGWTVQKQAQCQKSLVLPEGPENVNIEEFTVRGWGYVAIPRREFGWSEGKAVDCRCGNAVRRWYIPIEEVPAVQPTPQPTQVQQLPETRVVYVPQPTTPAQPVHENKTLTLQQKRCGAKEIFIGAAKGSATGFGSGAAVGAMTDRKILRSGAYGAGIGAAGGAIVSAAGKCEGPWPWLAGGAGAVGGLIGPKTRTNNGLDRSDAKYDVGRVPIQSREGQARLAVLQTIVDYPISTQGSDGTIGTSVPVRPWSNETIIANPAAMKKPIVRQQTAKTVKLD